jgi:serine/tyrosine/threonine adenylyltransferase
VFSSIDQMGRYAYANQPRIAQWNLARLAETLLPLFDADRSAAIAYAQQAIDGFAARFQVQQMAVMRAKLGLMSAVDGDVALIDDMLDLMARGQADFTRTFRALVASAHDPAADRRVLAEMQRETDYRAWAERWRARLAAEAVDPNMRAEAMRRANPAFIPRNHRVEEAIAAAVSDGDFSFFERLNAVLARPFDDQPDNADLAEPPREDELVHRTFCGT